MLGRGVPVVDGALFGIKAAVLVIVVEALIRIGRRALKTRLLLGLAALAFVGIFFFDLPFPLIVVVAGADRLFPDARRRRPLRRPTPPPGRWRQAAIVDRGRPRALVGAGRARRHAARHGAT